MANKFLTTPANPNASKEAMLKAAREKAAPQASLIKYTPPAECSDRLRLLADDSGSMISYIPSVREAIIEFLRNSPGAAAAIHLLCIPDSENKMSTLESDLPKLATLVKTQKFGNGETPLFSRMKATLEITPVATRLVVFTDGEPTDTLQPQQNIAASAPSTALAFRYALDADDIIRIAKEHKIPIDTIFFGRLNETSDAIKLLKYLAEQTGGYFLLFDPAKVDLKKALKYLAPVNRLMLTSESVRRELQDGRRS